MYQDIAQLLNLEIDAGINILNVSIDQSTQEPLNYVVSSQWDINRSFFCWQSWALVSGKVKC